MANETVQSLPDFDMDAAISFTCLLEAAYESASEGKRFCIKLQTIRQYHLISLSKHITLGN
ncbi:MAG TPA: hypothetical protein VEV44_07625 [Pseudoneobacillus sp.]|nr:hypothetical protein [Pseudoneobacillus sp.]